MATSTQLADLEINEVSGVDHPANLHEGWIVMKNSSDPLEQATADAIKATIHLSEGDNNVELSTDTPVADVEKDASSEVVDSAFRKQVVDLQKSLDEARAEAEAVKAERDIEKATQRANDWATLPGVDPAEFGPVLRSLHVNAPEEATQIESILDGCVTAIGESGVLKEIGTDADTTDENAWDQINTIAKGLVEAGSATDLADAIGKAAAANPDVYARYIDEIGGNA